MAMPKVTDVEYDIAVEEAEAERLERGHIRFVQDDS